VRSPLLIANLLTSPAGTPAAYSSQPMKTTALLLASYALLSTAAAQTAPATPVKASSPQAKATTARQTADHRAATYKGPKVVESTKALGNKMLHESKPAPSMASPVRK
jgi:hypothetical protein